MYNLLYYNYPKNIYKTISVLKYFIPEPLPVWRSVGYLKLWCQLKEGEETQIIHKYYFIFSHFFFLKIFIMDTNLIFRA